MKLLLADDHTLFRDALVQYIERAQPEAVVTLARDLHEAVDKMADNPDQDLVLLDLRMPGMNGMEGFKKMRDMHPNVRVALMSGVAEPSDVEAAFELGAVGYFPKTLSGKALLQAIEQVLAGEVFKPLDRNTNSVMPSYIADDSSSTAPYGGMQEAQAGLANDNTFNLTPRESDVLEYLVKGDSNKDIAVALGLQVVTVKLHVRGVCRKLGAKNRTQAALIAQEYGLGSK